jgi:hypothetical protein
MDSVGRESRELASRLQVSKRRPRWRGLGSFALGLLASGCLGEIGGSSETSDVEVPDAKDAAEVGVSGARRLTAIEYRTTVFDLVGVDVADAALVLPTDERLPFDNDFTKQTASQALIDAADLLAGEVAGEVVASPTLRENVVSCTPSGATDAACFRTFVLEFGRRALRRPLSDAEADRFSAAFLPHAEQASDFWVAVDSGLRAFLQHPEFLYRIEIGQPVPGFAGMFRLGDFEIATRLSYFLWGSTPPDWLLDAAEAGELTDPDQLRGAAETMLADPHALTRLSLFHAMWLGYEQLPAGGDLAVGMKQETNKLLERVVLEERRAWSDVLLAEETFLNAELATHYGLDAPTDPAGAWVSYGDSGRRGLLSQASFLSAGSKFGDTSPTQRGLLIRTRLMCETIDHPPPDLNVNVDEPPTAADPNACKEERYAMWQQQGCSQCHALMEPVGFGLESYDASGRFRTTELDRPDCVIDGQGTLEGVGEFEGPSELGELLIESGKLDACVARQIYRYTMGRFALDEADLTLLDRLVADATGDGEAMRLDQLMGELVASEAFQLRREEEVSGE